MLDYLPSIETLDEQARIHFDYDRKETKLISLLCEKAGVRKIVEGKYKFYEGADYIVVEAFDYDSFIQVREKLETIMGPCVFVTVNALGTKNKMNAFFRFEKYDRFSFRLEMDAELFPIEKFIPGAKIVKKSETSYEVKKAGEVG